MAEKTKYDIWQENYAKYKKQKEAEQAAREVRKAKFVLGDVAVDADYIKNYDAEAKQLLKKSSEGIGAVNWGESEQALKNYNKSVNLLKSKRVLINDWLFRNAQAGSYDELLKDLDKIDLELGNLGKSYSDLHTSMSSFKSADDYNRAVDTYQKSEYDLEKFYTPEVKKAEAIMKMVNMSPIDYDEDVFKGYLEATGKTLSTTIPLDVLYKSEYVGNKATLDIANEYRAALKKAGFSSDEELQAALDYAEAAKKVQQETKDAWYEIASKNEDFEAVSKKGAENSKLNFVEKDGWFEYATPEEKQTYYYYGEKHGEKAARDYYSGTLKNKLIVQLHDDTVKKWSKYGEKHPWIASVISSPLTIISGISDTIGQFGEYLGSKDKSFKNKYGGGVDMYDSLSTFAHATASMQSSARASIVGDSKAAAAVYDVVYGYFDYGAKLATGVAVSLVTGGNPAVIAAWLSTLPAVSSSIYDAKLRGLSDEQALLLGISSGYIEYITEKYSAEALLKPASGIWSAMKRGFIAEGSEEGASALLNFVADIIIAGDQSKFSIAVENYSKDNNVSLKEALKHQVFEELKGIGYDAFIGGMVGFLLGGSTFALHGSDLMNAEQLNEQYSKFGKILKSGEIETIQAILDYAAELPDTKLSQIALKNNANEIDDLALGALYVAVEQDIMGKYLDVDNIESKRELFAERYNSTDSKFIKDLEYRMFTESEYISNVLDVVATRGDNGANVSEGTPTDVQTTVKDDSVETSSELVEEGVSENGSGVLTEMPSGMLNLGFGYAQSSGGNVPADAIGLDTESELYKKLESAGLADSNGMISGQAIREEMRRRSAAPETSQSQNGFESSEHNDESEQGGFTEVSEREIYREKSEDDLIRDAALNSYRTPKQMQVEKVAELFGVKLLWDEKISEGYYNPSTHSIVLNPNLTVSDMYVTIFKHELIHHFESKKGYDGFKEYLFNNSPAFIDYIQKKVGAITHGEFAGDDREAIEYYTNYKYEQYKNSDEIPAAAKNRFATENAEQEIVADFAAEMLLFNKDVDVAMKNLQHVAETDRNLFQRIWDWIKDTIARFKDRGDRQDMSIIKDLEYLSERLGRVWDSANKKNSTTDNEVKYKLTDENFANYDKPITLEDIKILRDIGRKSINEFSPEEVEIAQKWAYKFYQQLGTKSPFFRRWFGDWRAYQTKDKVSISDIPQYVATNEARKKNRGEVTNKDTGWNISISREGETNTISHAGSQRLSEYGLAGIKQLMENACLFDTEVHVHHGNNPDNDLISFDHKLYALGQDLNGQIALYKITVEEYYQSKKNPDNKKFHNLRYIQKIADNVGGRTSEKTRSGGSTNDISATYSISDLFHLVKQYDSEFKPKPVNEVLINKADGKPKVFYHGTNENFTEFSPNEFAPREGSFSFVENREDAAAYGDNIFEVYLKGEKLADYDNQPSEFYRLRNKREQVEYLKERDYDGWYADMDSGGRGEVSVFSPGQIKSAEEGGNIGTFSESDANIKHSIGLAKDAVFKPDKVAKDLVAKYGDSTMNNETLQEELQKVMSAVEHVRWSDAYNMSQKIAESFEGVDPKTIADDIYSRTLDVRDNQVWFEMDSVSKHNQKVTQKENKELKAENKKLQDKLLRQEKRIDRLEKVEQDVLAYHNQQELKRLKREDRSKNLEHFRNVYNRLETHLRINSDKKHIPAHLKRVVSSFIKTFKSGTFEEDGKNHRVRITAEGLANFAKEYEATEFDSAGVPNIAYDSYILEYLEDFRKKADEKGLLTQNFSLNETLIMSDIADNLWHMVQNAEESFAEKKTLNNESLARPALKELQEKKTPAFMKGFDWVEALATGNITPPYFFKHLGETFYKMYNDIVDGQGKWALNVNAAKSFIADAKKKYNYSSWKNKNLVLKTVSGDEIKLTIEQALQLYATAKRQLRNRSQDAQHLNIGGIVLEDAISSTTLEKVMNELKAVDKDQDSDEKTKAELIKEYTGVFFEHVDNRAKHITYNDMLTLSDLLTDEQKKYVDTMVGYLSNRMASLGNETSLLLFGYEKFTESYYIPYQSAQLYLYSQPGMNNSEERLKHQSFTKNTVKRANTPLVLSSFSEVCAGHIDKMCMYNALTLPLENLNRVFNYKTLDDNGSITSSIAAEIEQKFGKAALQYMKQFIKDVNSDVGTSDDATLIGKLVSKTKMAAVAASLSVVIQQPSSIVRAAAYINPKYFFEQKDFKTIRKNYEQLCKYAPVAIIKQKGRFDTGVGVSTVKWLLEEDPEGVKNKVKAFFDLTDSKYRDDVFSYLAQKADEITWSAIWDAVKAEAKAETNFKVGSKEFYEHCGKRFTEVINLTQVYDSPLVRSQHMRDKSVGAKMVTAFMAEPTLSYNMLFDAAYRWKTEGKPGGKFAGRVFGAWVGSVFLNVILKCLVYAARDDDEDKSYLEKYAKELAESFVQEIIPLNLVPIAKDVVSLFEGYDVERMDMSVISDLVDGIKMIGDENKSPAETAEKLVGSIANLFGVPVKNIVRDVKAVINVISGIGQNKTTWDGLKFAAEEGLIGKEGVSSYYRKMVEAAEDGDEETYMEIYSFLIELGHEEKKVLTGVKSSIKKSDTVKSQAKSIVKQMGQNSTYESFDDEAKDKFLSKVKDALGVKILENVLSTEDQTYDKLFAAKLNDSKRYKSLKQDLLNQGVSESDININLFAAEIRYLERRGVDIKDWALAELAKSTKYADTDGSGSVSKSESKSALKNLDVDSSTRKSLWSYYGLD